MSLETRVEIRPDGSDPSFEEKAEAVTVGFCDHSLLNFTYVPHSDFGRDAAIMKRDGAVVEVWSQYTSQTSICVELYRDSDVGLLNHDWK